MFEIPLLVTGTPGVVAAGNQIEALTAKSFNYLKAQKSMLVLQEQQGQKLNHWERALKQAVTQLENFNSQSYASLRAAKSQELAQTAAVDAYYKQVDAVNKAIAANKVFNAQMAFQVTAEQNSLKIKQAEIQKLSAVNIVQREAAELAAKNAVAKERLNNTTYQSVKAAQQELAAQEKLVAIRNQEVAKLATVKARLDALSDTQRKQLAIDQELLRIRQAKAVIEAKATQQVRDEQAQLDKLTSAKKRNAAATQQMTAAQVKFNTELHVGNQLAASFRAALAGAGTTFGMYTSSTILLASAVYGLFRNIQDTVKIGANYTDMLARVGAVTSRSAFGTEEYAQTLEALNKKALDLSASTRFTASQVMEAMKELGMAGLNAQQVIAAVGPTMKLAAIGMLSYGEAADIATNVMMGFNLQVENLSHVVDVLALAVTRSNQSISQIGNALSYAAPVATTVGVSLEMTAAATMVLANAGIKASRAGTGLRRMFVSLFAPNERAAALMKQYGIEVEKAAEGMEGLEQMDRPVSGLFSAAANGTEKFVEKLTQFYIATDGARANIDLLRQSVGLYALPAFTQLIRGMEKGEDGLVSLAEALKTAGGAASDMFAKISDSLKADWEIFIGAMETAKLKIYDLEETGLRKLVQGWTVTMQVIANSDQTLKNFVAGLKQLGWAVVNIIASLAALKAAFVIFDVLKNSIIALATAKAALVSLIGTVKAVSAAFVFATAAIGPAAAVATHASVAFAALGAAFVKFAIPVAVIGAIAYFAAELTGLTDAVFGFLKAKSAFDEANTSALEAQIKKLIYYNEGGLKTLVDQKVLLEEQIAAYGRIINKTDEQNAALSTMREQYDAIKTEITEATVLMTQSSEKMLKVQEAATKISLEEFRDDLKEAANDIRDIQYLMSEHSGSYQSMKALYDPQLAKAYTDQAEALQKITEKEQLLLSMQKLRASQIDDTKLRQEAYNAIQVEAALRLEEITNDINKLTAAFQAMPDDAPGALAFGEAIQKLEQYAAGLRGELDNLKSGMESTSRVFPEQAAYLEQQTRLFRQLDEAIKASGMSEKELANARMVSAQKSKEASLQAAVAIRDKLDSINKEIETEGRRNELLTVQGALQSAATHIVKAAIDALKEETEAKTELVDINAQHADQLDQLGGRYFKHIAMQNALNETFFDFDVMLRAKIITLAQYSEGFLNAAESIFEFDSKTGKLTKSSQELINKQIEFIRVQIAAMQASKDRLSVLHQEQIALIKAAVAQGLYNDAVAAAKVASDVGQGMMAIDEEVKKAEARINALTGALNKNYESNKRAGGGAREAAKAQKELIDSYKELEPSIENYNKLLKASVGDTKEAEAATKALYEMQEYLIKTGEKLNYLLPKGAKELNDLTNKYDKGRAALQDYRLSMAEINALHEKGELVGKAYAEAIAEVNRNFQNSQGPMAQYLQGLRDQIKFSEATAVDFIDKFRTGLIDTLAEGKNGFEDFANYVKKRLIELAVNTIFINVIGNVGIQGGSGASGVAGAATGGGGGLGGLGSIGSLLSGNSIGSGLAGGMTRLGIGTGGGFWTGFGTNLISTPNWAFGLGGIAGGLLGSFLAQGPSGQIGSMIGSGAGTAIGAGLFGSVGGLVGGPLGAIAGALIGNAFGDKTDPRAQWVAQTGSGGFEDAVFARSNLLGLSFGLGGKSHKVDASQYAPQLQAMAAAADAIGAVVGPAVAQAIAARVGATTDQMKGAGLARDGWSAEQAFADLFGQILGFAEDTGDAVATVLAERVGVLSGSLEEMAAAIQRSAEAVAGAAGLSQALRGLGLVLGETEEASLRAALHLADLAGGAQAMLEATAALDAVLVPEAERTARALAALRETLAGVGLALPDSRAELRALVGGLDLTTEAGREAYVTVAALAQGLEVHFAAVEQSADQLRQAEAALAEQRRDASERLEQLLLGEEAYAALQAERAQSELDRIALERLGIEQGISSLEVLRATIDRLGGVSEAVRLLGDEAVAFAQAATNAFGGLAESVTATASASASAGAVQDEWWNRLTWGMREWLSEKYGEAFQEPLRAIYAWSKTAKQAIEEFAATSVLSLQAAADQVQRLLQRGGDVNSLNALPGALDSLLAAAEREAPSRAAYELIARRIQGQAERLSLQGQSDPAVYVRRSQGWGWDRVESNATVNTDLQLAQMRTLYEKMLRIFDRWDYDGLPATRT